MAAPLREIRPPRTDCGMVGERRRRRMNARAIPEKTRLAPAAASDPAASAWVAANAGSGKTHVLAQRAIRLLLAGVPPARILCLTFTKAAAAHMANQVLNTLREWVRLDDGTLDERLAALRAAAKAETRRRSRTRAALPRGGSSRRRSRHRAASRCRRSTPFVIACCINSRSRRTFRRASKCWKRPAETNC